MSDLFHSYEPRQGHRLPHDPLNMIVAPRPIGWISTRSASGGLNLAPYSFFNAFNYKPPIIGFSSIGYKDSVRNVEQTREFAWNLVTLSLAEAMNQTSAPLPPEASEFDFAGLTPLPSKLISAPRVAESPVSFECQCTQIVQLVTADGHKIPTWLVLGEVVNGPHCSFTAEGWHLRYRCSWSCSARRRPERLFHYRPRSTVSNDAPQIADISD